MRTLITAPPLRGIDEMCAPDDEVEAMTPTRNETSAATLTFPIQMVITIIVVVVSSYVAAWSAQSAQREAIANLASDIRVIRVQLDGQKENIDLKMSNIKLEVQNSELRKALLDELKANK